MTQDSSRDDRVNQRLRRIQKVQLLLSTRFFSKPHTSLKASAKTKNNGTFDIGLSRNL